MVKMQIKRNFKIEIEKQDIECLVPIDSYDYSE